MKKGWELKKIGDVCEIGDGNHGGNYPKKSDMRDFGVPFIRSVNLLNGEVSSEDIKYISEEKHKSLNKGHLKTGDVLFTNRGDIGKCAIVGSAFDDANLNSQIAFFRCSSSLYNRYLYYFLQSPSLQNHLFTTKTGAALQQFPIGLIVKIEISIPSLPEQQRIVSVLDEAFASIAQAKSNAERNLVNARELFEIFAQSIFENKGEGWDENKLNEVCELKSGTTISTSLERNKGDVLYTKIADMNLPENLVEIHTSSRFVNRDEINQNQIIPEGAIIFPKRGGAIATNKKRKIIKPTIVDLNTMAIIPSKKIDKDFLFYWFQLFDLKDISNGANIPQINNYSFDEIYIPYPKSLAEQRAIVRRLGALSAETGRLEEIYQQKIESLEELKKSVLQKAFRGEL